MSTAVGRYSLKENEVEARERLRAFWAGSSLGRPAILACADRSGWEPEPWRGPELDRKQKDVLVDWHIYQNQRELLGTVFLAEAMPAAKFDYASNLAFIPVLAGGDYDYHDSAWIKPLPDVYDLPLPRFDTTHPLMRTASEVYSRLSESFGRQAFLNPPAFLDAMTTLSLLRGAENLAVDLIESPERVKDWCAACTDLYIAAALHFRETLGAMGYGESCTWLGVMAEGAMEAVQCDFAVMLSPGMFAEFVAPDLARTTEALDFSLYHLDGTCQMRFLDQIGACPGLNGIQWNPEPPVGSPSNSLTELREIQSRGLCLFVSPWSAEEGVFLAKELDPDGLLISLGRFQSEAEAKAAVERLEKACV